MKKIIWIDIGTHFGQEFMSIFGSDFYFTVISIKRFLGDRVFRRPEKLSFSDLKHIIKIRSQIIKKSDLFYSIFVEANPKIIASKKLYLEADSVFNLALTSADEDEKILKLYLGNKDELSQGSSIFLEKHNVSSDSYVTAFGVSPKKFLSKLKEHIEDSTEDYQVMLRLNCEGVEDDTIYAAHEVFSTKLKLISGSLKDVKGIKGDDAYNNLIKFMSDNSLSFVYFSSDIASWKDAHLKISKLLN